MGSRWGESGPPEDAYSRVTRDLDAVYGGLHEVARAMVDELCRRFDVERVPMRAWWVDDPDPADWRHRPARPAPGLVAAWWLLPADPRCLPAAVALLDRWDVRVRHTWFADQVSPLGCTCDACDEDLDEAADALDGMLLEVTGPHREVVRPRLVPLGARWLDLEGSSSASGAVVGRGDHRADRLPRRADLAWPAWPARSLRPALPARPADPAP